MKLIYVVLILIVSGILEFFGITMVDRIDGYINNKIISSLIVTLYCIAGFVILVFVAVKLGVFSG